MGKEMLVLTLLPRVPSSEWLAGVPKTSPGSSTVPADSGPQQHRPEVPGPVSDTTAPPSAGKQREASPRLRGPARRSPALRAAADPAARPRSVEKADAPRPFPPANGRPGRALCVSASARETSSRRKVCTEAGRARAVLGALQPKRKKMNGPRSEPQAEWTSDSPQGARSGVSCSRQPR